MNPFPGERSVLVQANCPIHLQRPLLEDAYDKGFIVLFLEPYDPDSMPVEFGFKCMKDWMRKNGRLLSDAGLSIDRQLTLAARAVGRGASRHAFHAAGYI